MSLQELDQLTERAFTRHCPESRHWKRINRITSVSLRRQDKDWLVHYAEKLGEHGEAFLEAFEHTASDNWSIPAFYFGFQAGLSTKP